MAGVNLIKNLKALISVRVSLETVSTNGKFKFASKKNDSKSNYSISGGDNNDSNNEQKYSHNNDNNNDDKNNNNNNNKKLFENNNYYY